MTTVQRPLHAPPLGRHRLIGGAGLAALIDPDAVIDWWCHPGLDGPPQLWSLLDPHGGLARWWNATGVRHVGLAAGPSARTAVNIDGEVVSCWDALIRIDGQALLIRLARSTTRPLGITHELRAGGFGPERPATVGVASTGGPPHHVGGSTFCSLLVRPDEWSAVVIGGPEVVSRAIDVPALVAAVGAAEDRAQQLVDAARVVRSHRDRLETALLVLDACTDPESGAVVAAPTTSVPEVAGADRQFDYRYAWLRDASLAAGVAAAVGRVDITEAHVGWLTDRCLRCEGIPIPVVRTNGDPVPEEVEVQGVAGWAASQPIRLGNAAKDQLQVDGAGMAAEAVWAQVRQRLRPDRTAYRAVAAVADIAAERGAEPSNGIWELRERVDDASSDIGRWLLFDRVRRLSWCHEPWARARRARWQAAEDDARTRVLTGRLGSGAVPLVYGQPHADATGLLPVVLGLLDPRSPEATEIVDGTLEDLGRGDPLRAVLRYPPEVDDGFQGEVGAFVPVSWMAVSALARIGRVDEAAALADRLCAALPELQPEVLDGEVPLGNLPLVWSHAESARAVYLLRVAEVRRRAGRVGVALWRAAGRLGTRRRSRRLSRAR